MARKAREITLDQIANRLPIYIYFDKFEFSGLTGVSVLCSIQRLRTLVSDGFLERKGERGKRSYWLMTFAAKQEMLRIAKENKSKRGSNQHTKRGRRNTADFIHDIGQAENMAHREHCEMLLKSVNFI